MAPIVKTSPSYIKDWVNTHLNFSRLQFNIPGQDKLFFTKDLTSFYAVIPNDEGLLALKQFF